MTAAAANQGQDVKLTAHLPELLIIISIASLPSKLLDPY
jgi:hypothetical protein